MDAVVVLLDWSPNSPSSRLFRSSTMVVTNRWFAKLNVYICTYENNYFTLRTAVTQQQNTTYFNLCKTWLSHHNSWPILRNTWPMKVTKLHRLVKPYDLIFTCKLLRQIIKRGRRQVFEQDIWTNPWENKRRKPWVDVLDCKIYFIYIYDPYC